MTNEDKLSGVIQLLHELLDELDDLQLSAAAVKVAEAIDILELSVRQNGSGDAG